VISVHLKKVKKILKLEIKDNGVDLPVEFEDMNSDTLGLQLLVTLTEQLDVELKLDGKGGTKYLINFDNIKSISNV
tara:strand:+ start:139 stop:366 length:228 start_codon:yes stop_codon:yes gene_type:complete